MKKHEFDDLGIAISGLEACLEDSTDEVTLSYLKGVIEEFNELRKLAD